MKQIIFSVILLLTIAIFIYSVSKIIALIKLSKKAYPIKDIGKRLMMTLDVAFFQSKIFRRPVIGFMHAMVFWGFMVICLGTIEITIDGIFGTERILSKLGIVYDIITASGDIFGLIVLIAIIAFLVRRIFLHVKRFNGIEMIKKHHIDANIALSIILLLMVSLLSMNASYCALNTGKEITEDVRMKELQRMVKQRNESATIFKDANRPELYEKEIEKRDFLLPKQNEYDRL